MKRKIVLLVLALYLMTAMVGCGNKTVFDTKYTFNRAIIQLADGTVVDTEIKSWSDYDGEQLQIVAKDGTVYLTSSLRCDLINDTKTSNK